MIVKGTKGTGMIFCVSRVFGDGHEIRVFGDGHEIMRFLNER